MSQRLNEALEAYQLGLLAKDLTGRYQNVKRTLNNIDTIGEHMMSGSAKEAAADQILALVAKKLEAPKDDPVVVTPKGHTVHNVPQGPKGITQKDLDRNLAIFGKNMFKQFEMLLSERLPAPVVKGKETVSKE